MLGSRGGRKDTSCHSKVQDSSVFFVICNKDSVAGTFSHTDLSPWLVYKALFLGAQPCARGQEVLVRRQGEAGDRAVPVGSTNMDHKAGCMQLGDSIQPCWPGGWQGSKWKRILGERRLKLSLWEFEGEIKRSETATMKG